MEALRAHGFKGGKRAARKGRRKAAESQGLDPPGAMGEKKKCREAPGTDASPISPERRERSRDSPRNRSGLPRITEPC